MRHPINDDAAKLIAELDDGEPLDLSDPEIFAQVRNGFDDGVRLMRGHLDTSKFEVDVHDTVLVASRTIPLRVYEPANRSDARTSVVYFHGGGWTMGSLDTLDPELRWFAHRLGVTVVSVDYRLAPENPYPAALDDCMSVVRRLTEVDPEARIAVAGDSAGGTLAAAVSLRSRDEGMTLAGQLLINPAMDARQSSGSYSEFAEGFLLTRAAMEFNWSAYLQTAVSWVDPFATPSGAVDLSGAPPAVVVTAGYDPLRDEGVTYARRLRDADVACVHLHLPGMPHGFVVMAGRVPAVTDAVEQFLYHFSALLADGQTNE